MTRSLHPSSRLDKTPPRLVHWRRNGGHEYAVQLDGVEQLWFARQRARIFEAESGSTERAQLCNELDIFMELKYELGARMLPDEH